MSNDNKFISRNMYTGSGSRKPKTGFFITAACGIFVILFGIWRYFSMTAIYEAGGTVSVNRLENLVYSFSGFLGIAIVYVIVGIGIIIYAYIDYKNKTTLDNQPPQQ